jgi:hypothetical protein
MHVRSNNIWRGKVRSLTRLYCQTHQLLQPWPMSASVGPRRGRYWCRPKRFPSGCRGRYTPSIGQPTGDSGPRQVANQSGRHPISTWKKLSRPRNGTNDALAARCLDQPWLGGVALEAHREDGGDGPGDNKAGDGQTAVAEPCVMAKTAEEYQHRDFGARMCDDEEDI